MSKYFGALLLAVAVASAFAEESSYDAVALGRPDEPIAALVRHGIRDGHVLLMDAGGRPLGKLHPEGRIRKLRIERGELLASTSLGLERFALTGARKDAERGDPSSFLGPAGAFAVSPDGRWLAHREQRTVDLVRSVPALCIESSATGAETHVKHGLMPARHRPGDLVKGFHHVISNIDEPCGPGWLSYSIDAGAFSPDGSRLAVALERRVRIFAVPGGERIGSGRTGIEKACALVYRPDGRRLAVGGRELVILDGTKGTPVDRFRVEGEITSLAYSPDGRQLAIGLADHVELRDMSRGEPVRRFPMRGCADVAFSSAGARLAAAGSDGIRVWSLADGRTLLSVR